MSRKCSGVVGKKVPVVGAVLTAGFVLYETGNDVLEKKHGKAAAALAAGSVEVLGNVAGFGVGDAARECVSAAVVKTAGEDYAPDKSGLRQVAERIYDKAVNKGTRSPAAPKPVKPMMV